MIDRKNLPLSPLKIVKKSIPRPLPAAAIILFMWLAAGSGDARIALNLVVAFIVLIAALEVFYQYLYYRLYWYHFGEYEAEIRKGVVSRAAGHARYDRIQNIYVDQDILDRILGLYDVHYETAGESSNFYSHVDGLNRSNAEKLLAYLKEQVKIKSGTQIASETERSKTIVMAEDFSEISRKTNPIHGSVVVIKTIRKTYWFSLVFIAAGFVTGFLKTDNPDIFRQSFYYSILGVALIAVLSLIHSLIWFKTFAFNFRNGRGEVHESILTTSTAVLNYDRIQNVAINQGILERIFGIYKVMVETAGETSGTRFVIPGLRKQNADSLRNFLISRAKSYRKV